MVVQPLNREWKCQRCTDAAKPVTLLMIENPGPARLDCAADEGLRRKRLTLARAKANGVKLGRRRTKPSVEAQIVALRAKGDGIHKIRRKLGIGASVVQRVFEEVLRR